MKTIYKLSGNNKLIIIKDKIVLYPQGYFWVDKRNRLIYEVKEPVSWRIENNTPKRIFLEGKWSIDANHNLIFTLRKSLTQAGHERLRFRSQLIQAKANSLIFTFGTQGKAGTHAPRLLQLNGKWQADKHNRLQFLVKRLKASSDALTLQAGWQVKKNTLTYTYKKTFLKTKAKHLHTLKFKGYWQIDQKNRLTYILDRESDSSFIFKTHFETPNLIGKKGEIKYRVGIGVKGARPFKSEVVTLYGVWKFHRKNGLSLDIDYGNGRIKTICFETFIRTGKQGKLTLGLRNGQGKDLGLSVEFSRKFLKNNAEWFLRAVIGKRRPGLKWGVEIKW